MKFYQCVLRVKGQILPYFAQNLLYSMCMIHIFNAGINGKFPNSFTKPTAIQKGKLSETDTESVCLSVSK